jgi:hypothetical protein
MKLMSEGECVFYIALFILMMFGTMVYADRQRAKAERLQQELEHSEKEREFMSRLLHPARNRRTE